MGLWGVKYTQVVSIHAWGSTLSSFFSVGGSSHQKNNGVHTPTHLGNKHRIIMAIQTITITHAFATGRRTFFFFTCKKLSLLSACSSRFSWAESLALNVEHRRDQQAYEL